MGILIIFGVIALASPGQFTPVAVDPNHNNSPQTHLEAKGREFKGQHSSNGVYTVQLKLLSSLAPPFETVPDNTTAERIPNSSEQRNGDGYIKIQTLSRDSSLAASPYQSKYPVEKLKKHTEDTPRLVISSLEPPGSSQGQHVTQGIATSPYGPIPAGSGLEGQYIPDNLEKQFDDGSDKAGTVTPRLVHSPYGLVPAGSGLEGQHVPDNLEKRFDDGSDKAETVAPRLVHSPYGLVPAGSGLEGQHVPDNLEKRFDDGSDKVGTVSPRIVDTPYGPAPAGSGLQGQYVPDNLEKLYDDGSDKVRSASAHFGNSVYDLEGKNVPDNNEKRFDDGLYRPKGLEKMFDDGLYRPEELAKRFDDGIIRF